MVYHLVALVVPISDILRKQVHNIELSLRDKSRVPAF